MWQELLRHHFLSPVRLQLIEPGFQFSVVVISVALFIWSQIFDKLIGVSRATIKRYLKQRLAGRDR